MRLIDADTLTEKYGDWYVEEGTEEGFIGTVKQLIDAQPDTTTHDSISAKTGKNDGDGTSGDCISRQRSVDTLRKMQTYKLFAGDDMLLIDQAEAQTELMMLPPAEPDIIRCKDCEFWTKQENSIQGRCALYKMYPSGNWYCGTARRRGEQE